MHCPPLYSDKFIRRQECRNLEEIKWNENRSNKFVRSRRISLFSSIYMHTGHTRRLTQKATAVEGVNTDRRHTYKAHVQGTHTRHIEDMHARHTSLHRRLKAWTYTRHTHKAHIQGARTKKSMHIDRRHTYKAHIQGTQYVLRGKKRPKIFCRPRPGKPRTPAIYQVQR